MPNAPEIPTAFGSSAATAAGTGFTAGASAVIAVTGALLGMLVLGAAVASSPAQAGATVSFEGVPDEMLVVRMHELRFEPAEIAVAAGRTTALFLVNDDPASHSFDVDALDLHVTVGGNQTAVAMVTPEQPGTYELSCGVGSHAEAGMVGTLAVVEE